jgi:CMP-N-acetylneuraminic acid synthetase
LQKRAADVNIALKATNGMTLAQMGPQAHLTATTDAIDAKRLEYEEAEMKSLQTASDAEHETLKKRHMAEERALVERHVREHEVARQGRPEVDLAFHQNGKVEFEKRQALLEEVVGI